MSESNLHGERLLAMSVHNIGFLLDRLGQDCHPLQFLRELTQNGIEAIERTGEPGSGMLIGIHMNLREHLNCVLPVLVME